MRCDERCELDQVVLPVGEERGESASLPPTRGANPVRFGCGATGFFLQKRLLACAVP